MYIAHARFVASCLLEANPSVIRQSPDGS